MFPGAHLEIRHNNNLKNLHLACFVQQKELLLIFSLNTRATTINTRCTTSTAELLQEQNSSRSSSSRTHEARVSVAVRSACLGLTLEPFVHVLRFRRVFPGSELEIGHFI